MGRYLFCALLLLLLLWWLCACARQDMMVDFAAAVLLQGSVNDIEAMTAQMMLVRAHVYLAATADAHFHHWMKWRVRDVHMFVVVLQSGTAADVVAAVHVFCQLRRRWARFFGICMRSCFLAMLLQGSFDHIKMNIA